MSKITQKTERTTKISTQMNSKMSIYIKKRLLLDAIEYYLSKQKDSLNNTK